MKWLGRIIKSSRNDHRKKQAVRTAADLAMQRYKKIFDDLAKYDRGEKLDIVSR